MFESVSSAQLRLDVADVRTCDSAEIVVSLVVGAPLKEVCQRPNVVLNCADDIRRLNRVIRSGQIELMLFDENWALLLVFV